MNENLHPGTASDVPWPTSDHRMRVPDTSMLPDTGSSAEEVLQATTDRLRDIRDEWADSARTTVRGHPLLAVAAAVALGVVIARITR